MSGVDNIEVWEAVAQTLSVLVTSAAVIYAARQIKESNRSQRTSQYQAALQMVSNWRSEIITKPSLADRLKDGSTYFTEVLDEHGVDGYFHTLKLLHNFEMFFLLHHEKVISDGMWQGWKNNMTLLMKSELNVKLWRTIKDVGVFESHFSSAVDDVVAENAKKEPPPLALRSASKAPGDIGPKVA